jgi:glycosyltransferase involved in cell wall biosynthesis
MGIDVLLDAWARLDLVDGSSLLVVGQGRERSVLETEARRLGLERSVRFLGRVDEVTLVDCYQAADVVVLPSVALEGFGLAAIEALACGVPVIGTMSGGLPEVLAGLDADLVVAPGDAAALAKRMASALQGTAPLPDAKRCRRHAESFSWQRAGLRHRAIYARAAEEDHRRLRVVYLDHCALLSGGELALLRLLPALDEVDAHVVLAQDGPLVPKLLEAGISVEVVPMPEGARDVHRDRVRVGRLPVAQALQAIGYTCRLAWHLRRLRPDVVHTNSLKAALYGGVAGRLAGVPVVWHVRDRIADDYLPPAAVRIVKVLARHLPNAVIGNSRATIETLGPTPAPQTVVPSPVRLRSRSVRPTQATSERNPRQGMQRIGMVGRLAPWKGQHLFLAAFADTFRDSAVEAVLVGCALFGEADYEAELRAQVTGLGLDGRVEFRGFRDDVVAELERLDIVVHASVTPEPFGQVVVEAMAMGLPVVAADAGGPAEIVDNGVNGLLFPSGDVQALGRALARLSTDAGLRQCLAAAAKERAKTFAPEVVAPAVMNVYRTVLS